MNTDADDGRKKVVEASINLLDEVKVVESPAIIPGVSGNEKEDITDLNKLLQEANKLIEAPRTPGIIKTVEEENKLNYSMTEPAEDSRDKLNNNGSLNPAMAYQIQEGMDKK